MVYCALYCLVNNVTTRIRTRRYTKCMFYELKLNERSINDQIRRNVTWSQVESRIIIELVAFDAELQLVKRIEETACIIIRTHLYVTFTRYWPVTDIFDEELTFKPCPDKAASSSRDFLESSGCTNTRHISLFPFLFLVNNYAHA